MVLGVATVKGKSAVSSHDEFDSEFGALKKLKNRAGARPLKHSVGAEGGSFVVSLSIYVD
jgi:hypothetical protein